MNEQISYTLLDRLQNPYNYRTKRQFDPSSLPLEVAVKTGDYIWIGRNKPTDTVKYKLWLIENVEDYESIIEVGV